LSKCPSTITADKTFFSPKNSLTMMEEGEMRQGPFRILWSGS
jgi:hypothetical protein